MTERRVSRRTAERAWKERVARERGRSLVPGLDGVMARLGVANADLAWQVGVSESTVREWRKLRSRPRADHRASLAELLGVSAEELEERGEVRSVETKAS